MTWLPGRSAAPVGREVPVGRPTGVATTTHEPRLPALPARRDVEPAVYAPGGRNPFEYAAIAPVPPPVVTREVAAAPPPVDPEPAPEAPPPAPAAAPAAPPDLQPPAIPLRFIGVVGLVGGSERPIAVLLDEDRVLLAREGETVKKDFRIVEISYDTLRMGFTDPGFAGDFRVMSMGE